MSRIVSVLIFSLVVCNVLHAHDVCEEDYCLPPTGDLASGRVLSVNSSCGPGDTIQEVGEGLSLGAAESCDSNSSYLNDGSTDTSWVSFPGQENVVIQLDLETEFRLLSVNVRFVSLLPSAAVLEASSDSGLSWRPLQFYSTDCEGNFGMRDGLDISRQHISDVVCTSQYTGVNQLGGSLRFHLVLDKHLPYYATDPLHLAYPPTHLTLSSLRLRLLKFQSVPSIPAIQHYYSVDSFEVDGACHCFGHADTCVPSPGYEGAVVPGVCECLHNTMGDHCGSCMQGFNRRRWSAAYPGEPRFCQRCECNSHSTSCYYNVSRETQVCSSCDRNTAGDRCEKCGAGYFQNPVYLSRGWLFHPEICSDCACHSSGSLNPQCDNFGFCSCKANVMGSQCNRCKPGFYGLSADNPDGCRACNCGPGAYGCDPETGACLCKRYATGIMCQTCQSGYYGPFEENLYGCRYCRCAIGATLLPRVCHPENGTCLCRRGVEGARCSRVAEGYYVELITQRDVDTRLAPLVSGGDRVAKDLSGIWFDHSTQDKRCDASVSSSTCCSYSQKLISIYLNGGGLPCSCHVNGTQSDTLCDRCGGQCVCRGFTTGRGCDQCSNIEGVCATCPLASPTIGDCLNCFCNGFSQECSVASGWEHQLIDSDFNSQDWVRDSGRKIEPGYNPMLSVNESHLFYYLGPLNSSARFPFPPEYLGDKRNVYSNALTIVLRLNFQPASVSLTLQSSTDVLLVRNLTNVPGPGLYEFSFDLTESEFASINNLGAYEAATETDVRRTLAELGGMELLVTDDESVPVSGRFVEIFSVRLQNSVENGNESQLAANVESCECPIGHAGQFCERCSPGYTRSPESGGQFAACVLCLCNSHSATCHPEDGTCSNCQDNTEGRYCDVCRDGFYGNASSPQGCLPCQCPTGPSSPFQVSNSCVALDPSQPEAGHVCECPDTYVGQFCEGCVVGYRGQPLEGEACERCDVCYDQYLSLVRVIPAQLAALQLFVGSCQNWTQGFDYLDRLQANISTLQLLISKQKQTNSSSICQLQDSLQAIQASLRGAAESMKNVRTLSPDIKSTLQASEPLIAAASDSSQFLTSIPMDDNIRFLLNSTRDSISLSYSIYPDLVNASNAYYLEARGIQLVALYEADIAISRSIQLYLSLDTTRIPSHLDMLERFRNLVYEVSVAANESLCGGTKKCDLGTYQRIRFVAGIFESYLANLTNLKNLLQGPFNDLVSKKSSFEDLVARLESIRGMVMPLNTSVCGLVPVVEEWIQNVGQCLQQTVNASRLEVISTEILQLSIQLTVLETMDIVASINRTLEQAVLNKQYLTEGAAKLPLTKPFITNLNNYLNMLNASYAELLTFSSNITSHTQFITQELIELAERRGLVSNLSSIVDLIKVNFAIINASLPSLAEKIENASIPLNKTLELRKSNKRRLSKVEQNSTETIQGMTALRSRSGGLVTEGEKLAEYTRDLSVSVVLRFKKLNDSYPRLQALRARIVAQEEKVVELQELADNIAIRQTALEKLMNETESQLENVLNDEPSQKVEGAGKCLIYEGET